MSEVVRPVTPLPQPRSGSPRATWLVLSGAAVVCGAVIALAFSGRAEHATSVPVDEVVAAAIDRPLGIERPTPPVALAPIPDAPMTLASASQSISIEMYSATWCQACQAAHRWMDSEHIAYHVIDVDQHTGAITQLAMLNPHRTLPTFDVDGTVLVGFDQVALTSAIDGAARRHR